MNSDDVHYLSIQSTYQDVQIALYCNDIQLGMHVIKKINASADLIPSLDELLKFHHKRLSDLSFIVVNQGPAPFTTLRVVIASMNGLSFACHVPLIGIDGIKTLLAESDDGSGIKTVAVLDAFAHDVYYAYKDFDGSIQTGCMPISLLLQKITSTFPDQSIKFTGNGAALYKNEIKACCTHAIVSEEFSTCSLAYIAKIGLQQWQEQQGICSQLLPLYLKKQWWQ